MVDGPSLHGDTALGRPVGDTDVVAFGRDLQISYRVWSPKSGYPGHAAYRDFHTYDHLTGLKPARVTGRNVPSEAKAPYDPDRASHAVDGHVADFVDVVRKRLLSESERIGRPAHVVAAFDTELFGHWWYEGPEFLDYLARKLVHDQKIISLITPGEYLARHQTNQIATPSASSWGEEGYLRAWLNDKNEWIYPHLQVAQERMSALAKKFSKRKSTTALQNRSLKQAARELLLAQASDWPFILRAGTSPDYARRRVKDHLLRFIALHDQLTVTKVDEKWLREIESRDNLFPEVDWTYWK